MQFETIGQRHTYILNRLNQEEFLKISDLAEILNVSLVTIRKDIKTLETKNLVYKTHGAVYKTDPYSHDININEKNFMQQEQKKRIGEAAAKLVKPNDAILIASGTTVMQMANAIIPSNEKLTVVTSAMNVAMTLREKNNIEIIQLGGIMRPSSTSVVGPYAEEMLHQLSFSKLFLGVDGLEAQYGCSTTNMLEAKLNSLMIKAAQKTIILTDSTKFGKKSFGKICNLRDIDQIITDDGISKHSKDLILEAGVELTIV